MNMLKRTVVGTALLLSTSAVADPWPYGPSIGSGTTNIITTNTATATNGLNSQTLSAWLGQQSVNVLGQHVTGDGTTDDKANLLTAAGVAQSTGNILFIPTPSSSYKLNSDWKPAAGDFDVFMAPGVVFSGAGLPKFDNQFPHYAYPIFASKLSTRTYGSFYNSYANVSLEEAIAVNTGTANVTTIQGVGISTTTTSPTWGGNFVCEQQGASGSVCTGVEIDTINTVSGGNAYGLLVAAQGSFNSNSAITIGATQSGIQWTNGLVFQQTVTGGLAPATNAFIETTAFTGSVGKGMYMRGAYSNFEMSWPSFYVGPTPGTPTARIGITGGSGSGASIAVIANDGGSTTNELLSLAALGNSVVNIGNTNGIDFQIQDGGTSTINYGYVKAGATGVGVTYGCGFNGDANVNCIFSPRGTGSFTIQNTGGGASAQFIANASTISRLNFFGAASGSPVKIQVGGTATNLALDAGASNQVQFIGAGSWTANATTVVTLTALGPAGASTTIKKWLTVIDNTGATDYIPVF